jgi:hypothetical protein
MKPFGCHDMGVDHAQQGIQRRTTEPAASAMVDSAIGTPSKA